MSRSRPVVINFLGEPGCGKSTASTYVFSKLKMLGINCEYVSEFMKDKVYEENNVVPKYQEYVFGKQSFKLDRVKDKVDVIITDSPLILSVLYNTDEVLGEDFNKVVIRKFNSFDNYNILLTRHHEYVKDGRFQNEKQSIDLRTNLVNILKKYNIDYVVRNSNLDEYNKLVNEIALYLKTEEF